MANDIRARRVEDFCAFVDFSEPEDELYQRILIVILVLIESRKAAISILVVPDPIISLVQALRVHLEERSSFVMLFHFAKYGHQHACIVNVWSVLEFLSIRNSSIFLKFVDDKVLNNWMQFLRGFT